MNPEQEVEDKNWSCRVKQNKKKFNKDVGLQTELTGHTAARSIRGHDRQFMTDIHRHSWRFISKRWVLANSNRWGSSGGRIYTYTERHGGQSFNKSSNKSPPCGLLSVFRSVEQLLWGYFCLCTDSEGSLKAHLFLHIAFICCIFIFSKKILCANLMLPVMLIFAQILAFFMESLCSTYIISISLVSLFWFRFLQIFRFLRFPFFPFFLFYS